MSNLATITNNILADSGIDDINVVVTTGSYANPAWITSLAWTKITGAPANIVTGTGVSGRVAYWNGTNSITSDADLLFDGSNLIISGDIALTNGANRQISIGSVTNYNYRLRTDGDDFVITEAGITDRLRYSYSNVRWIITGGLTVSASTTLSNLAGTGTRMVVADSSGVLSTQAIGSGSITGSGTTNTLPKFTGSTTIGNSLFTDNGTNGAIGGENYSSGTSVRTFNISAPLYAGLAFWANNQLTGDIFSYGVTGNLFINADPTNIFSSSKIVFAIDGTERFSVFNNGNVAISSTASNPTARLEISANAGVDVLNVAGYDVLKWDSGDILTFGGYKSGQWNSVVISTAGSPRLTIASTGAATFSNNLSTTNGSVTIKTAAFGGLLNLQSGTTTDNWQLYHYSPDNTLRFNYNGLGGDEFILTTLGAATFSSSVTAAGTITLSNDGTFGSNYKTLGLTGNTNGTHRIFAGTSDDMFFAAATGKGFDFRPNGTSTTTLYISSGGAATFSSSVTSQVNNISADGAGVVLQGYVDNTLRIAARGSGYNSGARGGLLASTGDFSSTVNITTSSTTGYLRVGGGNGAGESRIFIEAAGNNSYIDSYGDNNYKPLQIQANNLILNSASGGNVLVGTSTNGGYRLDVAGQIRSVSSTPLIISMSTNASNDAVVSASWTDGNSMQMRYNANQALGFIDNNYPVTAGEVYGDIYFRQNVSGTMTRRMTIQARTGNVSIGTDTANQRLTVNGFVRASGLSLNEIGGTISGFIGYEKAWIGSGSSNSIAIAAEGGNNINFYTNGSAIERVRIDSNTMRFNPNNNVFSMYLWLNRQSTQDGGILMATDNSLDWQISNSQRDLWFYSYGLGTTAFRVMRNTGNFLIGTTTDIGWKLVVDGNIYLPQGANRQIFIGSATAYNYRLRTDNDDFVITEAGVTDRLRYSYSNTRWFISAATTCTSSITATSFFESSDATIKTLIEDNYQAKDIESVVAKLYIKNGKQELGYFAQDLEDILPSAVSKGTDGLLNLSYREVHTAKIAALEKEISELKKQLKNN
jgi:hypothetical protein